MKYPIEKHMPQQTRAVFSFILFCTLIFALSLRGLPGNPTSEEINAQHWKDDGPFELSPDRGRFALVYSLLEDRSFQFSIPLARFTTPDVGYVDGNYVSLFAPGLSFLIMPGYVIGKLFGLAQVGTFAIVALFAVVNGVLVRAIAMRLGAHPIAATIAALTFLFASPAFTYGVTLYQHHVSTFCVLLGMYLLQKTDSLFSVAAVWFLYALAVVVDNPNFFLMAPIAFYAVLKLWRVSKEGDSIRISFRFAGLATLATAALPLLFFMWFSDVSYGNPLQLPGTVRSVEAIDAQGLPTSSASSKALGIAEKQDIPREKSALGFFKTRNLLNGFFTHFISPDRGIVWYAPIILVGSIGFVLLYQTQSRTLPLLLLVVGVNVLLYSLWGDPYGGWAFASRYLIPSYAMLAIGIAIALSRYRRSYVFVGLFIVLLAYSVWVNTLGALTSSKNPPQIQILSLEALSGREEKYTYERNWDFLREQGSKSFVYQAHLSPYLNAMTYLWGVFGIIFAALLGLLWQLWRQRNFIAYYE